MSHHNGPRSGSRAFNALEKLYAIGGRASLNEWMNSIAWSESIMRFQIDVVNSLTRTKLLSFNDEQYVLTVAGLNFIDVDANAAPCSAPVLTAPQYSPGIKPLDIKRHFPQQLSREGSQSYRDIPSLIGGQRVAFTPTAGGVSTGRPHP